MRRRLLVTLAVAGLMVAGTAGPAAAHHKAGHGGGPPAHVVRGQAERLCERNNGLFVDLGGLAYACVLPTGATEREIRQAERLCERQGGALFVAVGNVAYACLLPGSNLTVVDPGGGIPPVFDSGNGLRLFPILIS